MKIISYQCSDEDYFNKELIQETFDYIFVQRCPVDNVYDWNFHTEYIKNFSKIDKLNKWFEEKGLCIISKEPIEVETYKFKNYAGNNPNQGKHYQITYIDGIKFINAGISFPDKIIPMDMKISQASEVMDLVDDNTILLGDFHNKDCDLPDELNLDKRNLMNHVHSNTYQQIQFHQDEFFKETYLDNEIWVDSLDKIITTKKCPFIIEGVKVLTYKSDERIHFPVSFYVR
tara:strand:+ start:485 stop:1174 length:690 start_codon:yes stop_codon:yes gene_type:complete